MNRNEQETAARAAWAAGHYLRAGELIYERIPTRRRPLWAARVLEVFCAHISSPPAVRNVLEIAAETQRWAEAHDAFTAVRLLTLEQERLGPSKDLRLYCLLHLAENVAKVTYNASGSPAPFDHDAGWWIPENAHSLLEELCDPAVTSTIDEALFTLDRRKNRHAQ